MKEAISASGTLASLEKSLPVDSVLDPAQIAVTRTNSPGWGSLPYHAVLSHQVTQDTWTKARSQDNAWGVMHTPKEQLT